jgi:hypothetical protein
MERGRANVLCAPRMDAWNHGNYCVPPEHLARLCESIEALFPWSLIMRRPDFVGYRLGDDLNRGALYLRATPAAGALYTTLERLRTREPELDRALAALVAQDADVTDHVGVRLSSVEEWETRIERARALARERPDLEVEVVRVERPGDPSAVTDYLYQAWVRLRLLGPLRNTFELQTLDPAKTPFR